MSFNLKICYGGILMKFKEKKLGYTIISAFMMVFFMLCVFTNNAYTATDPFPDISPNHWAYASVVELYNKGIIKGFYNEPIFRGEKKLSRYDMAVLLSRTLDFLKKHSEVNMLTRDDLKKIEKLLIEFSDEIGKLGLSNMDIQKEIMEIDKRLTRVEKNQVVLKKTVTKMEKEKKNTKLRALDIVPIIATGVLIGKVF